MSAAAPASRPLEAAVLDRIAAQVRPLLRLHGGDCELVGITDGVVTIRFLMACTACKLRPLTLLAAVRPRLLDLDGVVDVRAAGVGVSAAAVRRVDAAWGFAPKGPGRLLPIREAPNREAPTRDASTHKAGGDNATTAPPPAHQDHQRPTRQQPPSHLASQARNGKT